MKEADEKRDVEETMHTPGPWHVRTVVDDTEYVAVCSGGDAIAMQVADCGHPCPAHNANARLIAAAPDLYSALTNLREAFNALRPFPGIIEERVAEALIRQADNAIQKAGGK